MDVENRSGGSKRRRKAKGKQLISNFGIRKNDGNEKKEKKSYEQVTNKELTNAITIYVCRYVDAHNMKIKIGKKNEREK